MWAAFGSMWYGYEVYGWENIPDEGPALLVYYHGAVPIDYYLLVGHCILKKRRVIHSVVDTFLFKVKCTTQCKLFNQYPPSTIVLPVFMVQYIVTTPIFYLDSWIWSYFVSLQLHAWNYNSMCWRSQNWEFTRVGSGWSLWGTIFWSLLQDIVEKVRISNL